jgi:hypothetical protein
MNGLSSGEKWMLSPRNIMVVLFAVFAIGTGVAQSQPKPEPQNKPRTLGAQQSPAQPTPPVDLLTPEQIKKAIADGVNAAAKEYEARHPAAPPDNSGWWFNFWLVAFTGALVVVGVGQSYLIFWTVEATQTAANAAEVQTKDIRILQRAYIAVEPRGIDLTTDVKLVGQIVFKNVGRLPATGFASFIQGIEIADAEWIAPTLTEADLPEQGRGIVPIGGEIARGTVFIPLAQYGKDSVGDNTRPAAC